VIDAVDLVLLQDTEHPAVESPRRLEITPERLFDDDPAPRPRCFVDESGGTESVYDRPEEARRSGEVEDRVEAFARAARESLADVPVGGLVVEAAGHVRGAIQQPVEIVGIEGLRHELAKVLGELLPILGVGLPVAPHADESEPLAQEAAAPEVIKSRYQLSPGEVAGGAEDDDGARASRGRRGLRPFGTPGRDARFSSGLQLH
jgi:hypothetical protein